MSDIKGINPCKVVRHHISSLLLEYCGVLVLFYFFLFAFYWSSPPPHECVLVNSRSMCDWQSPCGLKNGQRETDGKEKKRERANPFWDGEKIRQRDQIELCRLDSRLPFVFPSDLLASVCRINDGLSEQGGLCWCLSPKTNTAERRTEEDNVCP